MGRGFSPGQGGPEGFEARERRGEDTYLFIAGEVVLQPTASGLAGTLDGYFRITKNVFAGFSAAEACVSKTHGFTLSR